MTLLPQLERELVRAAGRPRAMRRTTVMITVAMVAAILALMAAPPTGARQTVHSIDALPAVVHR